ncbi:MAG: TIGR03085 family metal-binding protein [Microthrixaceae bacterium]
MARNHAQEERSLLCDLFTELGPEVPTLCEGWDAADLAAHLVVRERRPDAALGILAAPLASHGEKVRREYARRPFADLVVLVRSGPPALSMFGIPGVDRLANTMEYFIHHEDVRRANDMGPRDLDADLEAQLWSAMSRMAKMMMRKAPAGITFEAPGARRAELNGASPMVSVSGPVGELALFAYGRQAVAEVELAGPDAAVEAVRNASFGV